MTTKVLVIVEDEADMRQLIKLLLTADPRLEVVGEATTAAEAVEQARTHDPGLIVLDHQIEGPVMGLEAAPALKEAAPDAKILLFSAFDLRREARLEPAIDAYLSKDQTQRLLPVALELLGLQPAA